MGCTASKLENEDVVRRSKDRRRLIKEAVQSRHHLASAHADYLRSLLSAASSLTRFAAGAGTLPVSNQTPPVVLRPPPSAVPPTEPSSSRFSPSPPPSIAPIKNQHHRPPPPRSVTPTVASRSALSKNQHHFRRNSATYAATPSQASSVWDWDNFYPPSPPDSDYFDRLKEERERKEREQHQHQQEVEEEETEEDEEEILPNRRDKSNVHDYDHHLREEDEDEEDEGNQDDHGREEVHCREWDEHCSTTTTSSTGDDDEEDDQEEEEEEGQLGEEIRSRSRSQGFAARSDFGGSSTFVPPPPLSEFGSGSASSFRKPASALTRARSEAGSSYSAGDLRMVVRHRDLAEIVAALEEYFVKAAAAGEGMSEFLETGRDQLDRSFRQLKKTVYHSNTVLSALSSSWSSKPPLAIKYRLDTGALEDSGGGKSHGSTLERLLAWEKKLYEEIKAREGVKIEHGKKLSSLQNLECRGKDDAKLYKTKVSIQRLQSLIMVTSQAVSTTSIAITKVRDNELAPQLVNMCFSLLTMWRSIHQFHEVQNHIVQQVRGLVSISAAGDSTSDLHRLATRDLEAAVAGWHSGFNRLIKYQREYIRALYSWLKLTLIHVGGNDDNHRKEHSSSISVKLTAFCDEWKQALDRLPDTVASEAIKSFVNVVHVISTKQEEELRIKKKIESYSRELDKKSTALRAIEKKFYQSYSTVGIAVPGSGGDGQIFDSRDPLAEKKSEIAACRRKVEEEMARHSKAMEITRSMTLSNIQTGLPGVFQALTGFSGLFAEALEGVCRCAEAIR